MASSDLIVDIHTHMYPPSYIDLLASRTTVPYIHRPSDSSSPPRLIILSSDDDSSKPPSQRGRPVDTSYTDFSRKLAFMRAHSITCSVISLANPWLDFLDPSIAAETAKRINDDLDVACAKQNEENETDKLFAFASLPLSAPAKRVVVEIERLKGLKCTKGIIMGTTGLGNGLDDPALAPIWSALEATSTLVFLHPHYGLPAEAFGGTDVIAKSGHVLPLALGFPLETTIAVTRMYLAGVFDRHPKLQMLLAHSGGTLPFLAGRIESCIAHEREFTVNGGDKPGPERSIWDVLRHNIYLDAVIYGEPGLRAAIASAEAAGGEGVDRVMFGTDHPFFPPLGAGAEKEDAKWLSVDSNLKAVEGFVGSEAEKRRKILGSNAVRVLGLDL